MKHWNLWFAELLQRSESLSSSARIAFVASIAERLYPNYVAFVEMCDFGEPQILRARLDEIWDASLVSGNWDQSAWSHRSEALVTIAPDSDEFSCIFVVPAQLAVGAVWSAGMLCSQPSDLSKLVEVSQCSIDSLRDFQCYASLPLDGDWQVDWDDWLDKSPLIVSERVRQMEQLEILTRTDRVTDAIISKLREVGRTGICPPERGLKCERWQDGGFR